MKAVRGTRSLRALCELFEDTIQLRLSLDGLARFHERLKLLLHRLEDVRWIAPAFRHFLRAFFDALNFFSEPFAGVLPELRGSVLRDLAQLRLLFWRQQILDRHP